jgi:MFS family permease
VTDQQPTRPPDVDTGFWLWVVALPLMVTGYLTDALTSPTGPAALRAAVGALVAVVLSAVVVTFLLLMRAGYRWACTLLTGGGCASVVYAATSLFTEPREMPAAFIYAASTIVGSVLIAGGTYLLHRKDAHAYFTR